MKKTGTIVLILILLLSNFSLVYAADGEYKTGDVIEFGSYPQSRVVAESLIDELNALAPDWSQWMSYGYYSGDGKPGSMIKNDDMRYTDILLDGEKYRGVKFVSYRPTDTCDTSEISNSVQAENGYLTDEIYWFRFEPIKWRVLSPESGFVVCETVIDAQPYTSTIYRKPYEYYDTKAYFGDEEYNNFANYYENATIRNWLNDSFYNTAFSEQEKEKITTAVVANNEYSSDYEGYVCSRVSDKIFLLSETETENSALGFNPCNGQCQIVNEEGESGHSQEGCTGDCNITRMATASDYAYCQGLKKDEKYGTSCWLLRTYRGISSDVCGVYYSGYTLPMFKSNFIDGIRPAMKLKEHTHTFDIEVRGPYCISDGKTTYTCFCGEQYVEYFKSLGGHNYSGSQCTVCGFDKADNCSRMCHKDGFTGFIWKILNVFCKIFRVYPRCKCGSGHY